LSDELAESVARVGRVLNDKWTLERLLGVGGMAAVYAGRHRNGARAAVKILHAYYAKEPAVVERFLREGYAANRVEHRGGVQVLDDDVVRGGLDDGAAYLVMELLDGESLEDRATRPPPLGEREFLTIAEGVLDVLEAAHDHGVVHRDLKPGNIFLARDPDGTVRVKLLDFGLARLTELAQTTQFGLALGTPSYMSPEQAAGLMDKIDGRTDIFALGATGFRLLTHRRIHEGENMQLLIAMANEAAPRVRDVAPLVSEPVAAIIDRALAFRREDRYSTAAAMRADIRAALAAMQSEEGRGAAFAPSGRTPSVRDLEATSLSEPEPVRPPAPPERSLGSTARWESRLRGKKRWRLPLVTATFCTAIFIAYLLRGSRAGDVELVVQNPEGEVTDVRDAGHDAQKSLHAASNGPKPAPKPSSPKKPPTPAPTLHKPR
jgi:eukaryotic-like serine/threonine-protein kinase